MHNNAESHTQSRRSLTMTGLIYFGSVLLVGFPVMYLAYSTFIQIFGLLGFGGFIASSWGITVVAVAFVVGMWIAGKVAERGIARLSQTHQ